MRRTNWSNKLAQPHQESTLDTLKVWVADEPEANVKSAFGGLARAAVGRTVEIGADAMRESVEKFAAQFSPLLNGKPLGEGSAVIDEIELSLTVSASGSIELLGKAAIGSQASIKIKLKRDQGR